MPILLEVERFAVLRFAVFLTLDFLLVIEARFLPAAFRFLVLAAFFAAALLCAFVCTILTFQKNTIPYSGKVNSFYSNG